MATKRPGSGARHEDRDAGLPAAPGPADLLPRRGDVAGISRQHGDVQPADVDAELERVGAHDTEDLACPQASLDGPASLGR
jgi:hypothetical protein